MSVRTTAFLLCSDPRGEILRQVHLLYREQEGVEDGFWPPTSRVAFQQPDCRDLSPIRGEGPLPALFCQGRPDLGELTA